MQLICSPAHNLMRVKCAACLLLCCRAHPYEQALLLLQRCWYWTGNATHVFAKDNAGADVKKGLPRTETWPLLPHTPEYY